MLLLFLDVLAGIYGTGAMAALSFLGLVLLFAYDYKTALPLSLTPEEFQAVTDRLTSVRYWGGFFVWCFQWSLLLKGCGELSGLLRMTPSAWPGVFLLTCCLSLLTALNIYALYCFVCLKRGGSRLMVKMLWVTPPVFFIMYLLFSIMISSTSAVPREELAERLGGFNGETVLLHIAWSAGWLTYFSRSRNVKELNEWLEHPERLKN